MPDPTPEQVRAVASVVAEYIGGDDPSDPHSWRCYDKERYPGNCGCDRDLATYILAAVRTDPAVQDAMLAALAEGGRLVEERRVNSVTVDVGDGATCVSEACVWWPGSHGHVRVTHRRRVEPWREVPQ